MEFRILVQVLTWRLRSHTYHVFEHAVDTVTAPIPPRDGTELSIVHRCLSHVFKTPLYSYFFEETFNIR